MAGIGAFAIIQNDAGAFLVSHRRDLDLWNLPGGGVEGEETPWDAVVREVREETGLQVAVDRLQGVYAKAGDNSLVFSFVCRVVAGALRLGDEADEHRFVTLEQVPANFPPKQLERLRDFRDRPHAVTMKTQTLPSSRDYLASLGVATQGAD